MALSCTFARTRNVLTIRFIDIYFSEDFVIAIGSESLRKYRKHRLRYCATRAPRINRHVRKPVSGDFSIGDDKISTIVNLKFESQEAVGIYYRHG